MVNNIKTSHDFAIQNGSKISNKLCFIKRHILIIMYIPI